jgi:hypothetical protein
LQHGFRKVSHAVQAALPQTASKRIDGEPPTKGDISVL